MACPPCLKYNGHGKPTTTTTTKCTVYIVALLKDVCRVVQLTVLYCPSNLCNQSTSFAVKSYWGPTMIYVIYQNEWVDTEQSLDLGTTAIDTTHAMHTSRSISCSVSGININGNKPNVCRVRTRACVWYEYLCLVKEMLLMEIREFILHIIINCTSMIPKSVKKVNELGLYQKQNSYYLWHHLACPLWPS